MIQRAQFCPIQIRKSRKSAEHPTTQDDEELSDFTVEQTVDGGSGMSEQNQRGDEANRETSASPRLRITESPE